MTALTSQLWRVDPKGKLSLHPHKGQARAWKSTKRFIVVLAGKQSGKTTFAPWWLAREIGWRGPGDYIAGTATYDLFKLKLLPALRECFEQQLQIGRYWSGDRILELADQTPDSPTFGQFLAKRVDDPMWGRIILRSADSATGWASATAKGGILDEAGEPHYNLGIWNEAQARVAIHQGRLLLPTTIYDLGWLKTTLYDPWEKAQRANTPHPEIDIIQFDSTENPSFPREEFERLRAIMPLWKFNLNYRGMYERPAGMIYDCFNRDRHTCPPFAIPDDWQRYLGLDFGGVNTAAVLFAEDPISKRLYLYRAYKEGGKSSKDHAKSILDGEPTPWCVGGSKSEGQWRTEFRLGGLPINAPDVKEVEIGINRVYAALKNNDIIIFTSSLKGDRQTDEALAGVIDEFESYSRPVSEEGEIQEGIVNKETYHFLDATRYIIGRIRRGV